MPIIVRWSSHMRSSSSHPRPSVDRRYLRWISLKHISIQHFWDIEKRKRKKQLNTEKLNLKVSSLLRVLFAVSLFPLALYATYALKLSVCVPIQNIFSYYILPYILELACRLYAYALDLIIHQHHGACVLDSTMCADEKENVKWNQTQSCSVCMRCVLRQLCAPLHHQFLVLSENSVSSHLISFCVVLKSSSELTEPWISRLRPLKWE